MADWGAIPLVLRSPKAGRVEYGLPRWYRPVMAAILGVLAGGLALAGERPGALAWVLLAVLLLALLYQEVWVFDCGRGQVLHRAGLLLAARATAIPFAQVERLLIAPLVEGTIPGSEDERRENAAALRGGRADDHDTKRFRHKKPYLELVLECADGTRYLVDRVPARQRGRLRAAAARLAEVSGKPLEIAGA